MKKKVSKSMFGTNFVEMLMPKFKTVSEVNMKPEWKKIYKLNIEAIKNVEKYDKIAEKTKNQFWKLVEKSLKNPPNTVLHVNSKKGVIEIQEKE